MDKWKQSLRRLVPVLLGGCLFLLLWLWLNCHMLPWETYLPTGFYNDEVTYNRQLAAVLHSGAPQGFFGYNERTAPIGTFDAWGPVLFYVYAIPGLLTGGSYNAFYWCNLLFALAGWLVLALGARFTLKQSLVFGAGLALIGTPLLYVFSGMSEPIHYALAMAVVGLSATGWRRWSTGGFLTLVVLCSLGTIIRPYDAVFFIFPLAVAWRAKKMPAIVDCVASAGLATVLSLVSIFYFSTPYFSGGDLDWEPLRHLKHGRIGPFADLLGGKLAAIWQEHMLPVMQGGQNENGKIYWVFYALLLVLLVLIVCDKLRGRAFLFKGYALVAALAVQGALLLLYFPQVGGRHLLVVCLLILSVLVYEDGTTLLGILATLPVLAILFVFVYGEERDYAPSRYNPKMDAELTTLNEAIAASQAALSGSDPWDRTFAFAFLDPVFSGYLYAVPAGMGIEFDENFYLANPENPIGARYVMTRAGTEVEARLLAENWVPLIETEHCLIYERTDR